MKNILGALLLICACNGCVIDNSRMNTDDSTETGTILRLNPELRAKVHPHATYDSIALIKFDTNTIEGKRREIQRDFILQYFTTGDDTLFDINYDGHLDYLIMYYGSAGTGIKNYIEAYIYNPKIDAYKLSEQISSLSNPSFYISKKKITGFYIAYGCGEGSQLEWIKNEWVCTKKFHVCNQDKNSEWEIVYPLKNDTQIVIGPYMMLPPREILENNYVGNDPW